MRNRLKRKSLLCAVVMMGFSVLAIPVTSVYAEDNVLSEDTDAPVVEPRTDKKEWVYKVIDGHFYKRLYNYSTGRWETDWILVE